MTDKVCQSGWKKFENNCYFSSTSKKTWYLSRNYCQGKGADLVIINSKAEMVGSFCTLEHFSFFDAQ